MKVQRLLTGIAVALCLTVLPFAGDLRAEKPTKTVTGVVKKYEEHRGKIRSVYIKDTQDGDFLVFRGTEIGKELLKHVGATVKATGYIRKPRDTDFDQAIDVLDYEIVPAGEPARDAPADP